jgi:hypothetical protein
MAQLELLLAMRLHVLNELRLVEKDSEWKNRVYALNDDMPTSWRPLETIGCIGRYLLEEEGSLLSVLELVALNWDDLHVLCL